jgi:hypothetical protein
MAAMIGARSRRRLATLLELDPIERRIEIARRVRSAAHAAVETASSDANNRKGGELNAL